MVGRGFFFLRVPKKLQSAQFFESVGKSETKYFFFLGLRFLEPFVRTLV